VDQKLDFVILRIEVTRASRGLSAISELLVSLVTNTPVCRRSFAVFYWM